MDNLVPGTRVTVSCYTGVYTVIAMHYDGSCTVVDRDGKHTYRVHLSMVKQA